MFLDLEDLNIEQLLEKQIELRQKLSQAHSMNLVGPAGQIQNMIEQISIEIKSKSQIDALKKEREKRIEEGKDPDDDVLNIDGNSLESEKLTVFGNLPYNISTEILRKWILSISKNKSWFDFLVLMFQKEVA